MMAGCQENNPHGKQVHTKKRLSADCPTPRSGNDDLFLALLSQLCSAQFLEAF